MEKCFIEFSDTRKSSLLTRKSFQGKEEGKSKGGEGPTVYSYYNVSDNRNQPVLKMLCN